MVMPLVLKKFLFALSKQEANKVWAYLYEENPGVEQQMMEILEKSHPDVLVGKESRFIGI